MVDCCDSVATTMCYDMRAWKVHRYTLSIYSGNGTGSRAPAKTHKNAYLSMCNANGFGSVKIVMKSSISFEMRRTERFCFSVFQLLPGRARRVSDAFVLSRPNYVLLEFSDSLPWLAGASFSRFCNGTLCAYLMFVAVLTEMVVRCIFVRL